MDALPTYVSSSRLTGQFLGMLAYLLGRSHLAGFELARCLNGIGYLCLSVSVVRSKKMSH